MAGCSKYSFSPNPTISFGMPLYNSEKYVADAIESLLRQTYESFNLIAIDDCSRDKTAEILGDFASVDRRIVFLKNKRRLGMIMNWRKTFIEARKRTVDYFAWSSDHDLWDPEWLENHVNVLNTYPNVILAYSLNTSIDINGEKLPREPTRFETFGMGKRSRVRATCTRMVGAGNMIYGLFKADFIEKCRIFPYYSMPDRLLLMQMSAYGTYKQIPQFLWHRRYFDNGSGTTFPGYSQMITRQRSTLFSGNNLPWHSHFPTLGQAIGLLARFSLRSTDGNYRHFFLGLYMALLHLLTKKSNIKIEFTLLLRRLQTKINSF